MHIPHPPMCMMILWIAYHLIKSSLCFALQSPRWYVYYKHIINWFFFGRDLSWICNHLKLWLVLISGSHQQQIQRPWRDELLKNGHLLHVTWPLRWEKIHDYILSHLCCTTSLDKESQELSTNVKVSWCYSFFSGWVFTIVWLLSSIVRFP